MPKFQENTGFKLPGVGSKEIDTPGVFRKDQGVEDVGYCSNTEPHMLPKGSSPLLKSMIDQVVPEYYRTSYTRTSWPVQKGAKSETKTANPEEIKTTTSEEKSETKDKGINININNTNNAGGAGNLNKIGEKEQLTFKTQGSDQGNTGVSYEEGYKKADKKQFPTLDSFKTYVKDYWKKKNSKDITVEGYDLKQIK